MVDKEDDDDNKGSREKRKRKFEAVEQLERVHVAWDRHTVDTLGRSKRLAHGNTDIRLFTAPSR